MIQAVGTNWTQRPVSANGEGKSLRRVAMVAKFLDLNKRMLCKNGRKTQKFDMHDFPGMICF